MKKQKMEFFIFEAPLLVRLGCLARHLNVCVLRNLAPFVNILFCRFLLDPFYHEVLHPFDLLWVSGRGGAPLVRLGAQENFDVQLL